jgi:benzaldehyde dehydrogenase (NAD)
VRNATAEIFALAGLATGADAVAVAVAAGMVHVNDATPQDEALAPFGGVGQSGLGGRSGGNANIEEFTERCWLTVTPGPAHYPY